MKRESILRMSAVNPHRIFVEAVDGPNEVTDLSALQSLLLQNMTQLTIGVELYLVAGQMGLTSDVNLGHLIIGMKMHGLQTYGIGFLPNRSETFQGGQMSLDAFGKIGTLIAKSYIYRPVPAIIQPTTGGDPYDGMSFVRDEQPYEQISLPYFRTP